MIFGDDPLDVESPIVTDAMLQQHAEIIDVLDLIIEHCCAGSPPVELVSELDTLVHLTQMHFQCEENFGMRSRRPKSASHVDDHRRMAAYLVKLRRDADEDSARLLRELRFFDYWLGSHIAEECAPVV